MSTTRRSPVQSLAPVAAVEMLTSAAGVVSAVLTRSRVDGAADVDMAARPTPPRRGEAPTRAGISADAPRHAASVNGLWMRSAHESIMTAITAISREDATM